MIQSPLKIAFLTYSTKPRGSVMQTLCLAETLQSLGHTVCIFALSKGDGFCRPVACDTRLIPAQPAPIEVEDLVRQRTQEFVNYFEQCEETYDYYHAQDCISANALAILRDSPQRLRHPIPHFIRTIHHIEDYSHPYLRQCQDRSILLPDLCFCVSQYWQEQIWQQYQVRAKRVINGIDTQRFTPFPNGSEAHLQQRLQLNGSPIYLTIGGIEPRKNSVVLLKAFAQVLKTYSNAQLITAGGATFFDYFPYQEQFFSTAQQLEIPESSLILPGVISDRELPALYRCADAFVFPSIKEGWGLVLLEAIATRLPIVTSNIPPFTEFLTPAQALLVEPNAVEAIAQAMIDAVQPILARSLIQQSQAVLSSYSWATAAQMHLKFYDTLSSPYPPL
jgi:glycosyltransferase-like protein